ncbi:MAG: hypothetical protein IJX34_02625 [Clostridia bacterium]|nr:hypothetical protein [Clostridia bacterium]
MENKRMKRGTKRKLKGEVRGFLFCLFLIWTIVGTMFLVKVTPDLATQFLLKDNRQFIEEHGNPSNWESRDEAYLQLVEFNNSLINSEDDVTSFFFSQNGVTKLVILLGAVAPYLIIINFVVKASDKKNAKKQALNRRVNQTLKTVR